jgi:16S rRNA G527 N7-methylase RsmG
VVLLEARLEEKIKAPALAGRHFSFITSRAFTDTRHFVKLAAPYLEKGGRLVLMKGPGAVNELNESARKGLGNDFSVSEIRKLYLPFAKVERLLVSIRGPAADIR